MGLLQVSNFLQSPLYAPGVTTPIKLPTTPPEKVPTSQKSTGYRHAVASSESQTWISQTRVVNLLGDIASRRRRSRQPAV